MNQAAPVRRIKRVGKGDPVLDGLVDVEWSALQPVLQRLALEALHDQKAMAICVADVVQRADVGVIQRGNRLRLAIEPRPGDVICGECRRQDLERYRPVEPRIARLVDLAHAAGTQGLDDFVGAESRSWRGGHSRGWILRQSTETP